MISILTTKKILFSSRIALLFLLTFSFFHTFASQDNKVVLREYKTVYTFTLNKKTKEPQVTESVYMVFESLYSNAEVIVPAFYDESSSLSAATILDARNRRTFTEKVCGNYEDGEIFYSDTKLCVYRLTLDAKGETASFSASKEFLNMRYFTSVYLPFTYKALQRTVEFHIPEWLNLDLEEYHLESFGVKKHEATDARKKLKIVRYSASNLAGYENGAFLSSKSATYPHIIPIVRAYEQGGQQVSYMNSTQDLYNWYSGLTKVVDNKPSVMAPLVAELIKDKPAKLDQIRAIYHWVQDNIRYIAFEEGIAGFKPETCQKVFTDRYGDCKGMANLTKEMLLLAGFDARLAWIGTNNLIYTYKTPSLAVDNHMICVAFVDGDTLILDATEKFISVKDHAERIQGKELLIENKQNYIIHKVPVLGPERNKREKVYKLAIANGVLKGKGVVQVSGEMRTSILYTCNNVRNEATEELLKRSLVGASKDLTVQSLAYSSLSEREKPFKVDFDLTLSKNLTEYEGEYYFQPDISPDFVHLNLEEDRISKLDFKEKIHQSVEVRLKIPAGYYVSHKPDELRINTDEFTFNYSYKVEKDEIIFRKLIHIPKGAVSKASFLQWNEALKSAQKQSNDQIILSKK